MEVIEVAEEALKVLTPERAQTLFGLRHSLALRGILQGVVEGNIVVGQKFIGEALLSESRLNASYEIGLSRTEALTPHEFELIKNIFASGLACEGQPLAKVGKIADKNWSSRG